MLGLGQGHAAARVAWDSVVVDRGAEYLTQDPECLNDRRHADLVGDHLCYPGLHRRCLHVDHRRLSPPLADVVAPCTAPRLGRTRGKVALRCRPRGVHLLDSEQTRPRRHIGTSGQFRGDIIVQPRLGIHLPIERFGSLVALVVDIPGHPALTLTVPGTVYFFLVSVLIANGLGPAVFDPGPTIALHPHAPPSPSSPPPTAPACLAHAAGVSQTKSPAGSALRALRTGACSR